MKSLRIDQFEENKWLFLFHWPTLLSNQPNLGPNVLGWRSFVFGIAKFSKKPQEGESLLAMEKKGFVWVIHYWLPWFWFK